MPTDALSDARVRALKPKDKPYKAFDGGGLHLYVSPTGAKAWRLAYRLRGKPKTISFGLYPEVGLAEARRRRDEARQVLRDGGDPMEPRKASTAITLADAADAYWAGRKDVTDAYRGNALACMRMHVNPWLGDRPLPSITRDDLMGVLKRMDAADLHDYVRKARMWLSQVFDWGMERGECPGNPAALIKPEKAFARAATEHFAAVQPEQVGELMRRLSFENPSLQSVLALRFLAYTWVRTTEMRMMLWSELVKDDQWVIPTGRMKRARDHVVPLPVQAQAIIKTMRERCRGSRFVFPGDRSLDRPMSENAVLALLYRVGYKGEMTGHGWRSIASTWANERGYPADAIERQLAHVPGNKVRSAYNRAEYLTQRRQMLQDYADWLDSLTAI